MSSSLTNNNEMDAAVISTTTTTTKRELFKSPPNGQSQPSSRPTTPDDSSTPGADETVVSDEDRQESSDDEQERRRLTEEEESIELARRLMAEEAMASYQQSFEHLRQSADQLSQEDYQALQAVLEEEQHGQVEDMEDEQGNLSYETMLQLGERIGDVKTERWTMKAEKVIDELPSFQFQNATATTATANDDVDDSERKCLVCQCEYEQDEHLKRLPCGHCFHGDCVGQWLQTKDVCPYCRQSIVNDDKESS